MEVLKGSAAVPYGAGEPGGVVNFVTKKPRTEQSGEASIRAGTFRQRGGHAEVTRPLVRGRSVFYRAAWFQEDRRSFRYNSENQNVHVANALSWKIREATAIGLEYEYIDQQLPGNRLRGIPSNSQRDWLGAREWVANEPTDFSALQARVFQARLDHAFTPTLRTDATFRFLNSDRPERYHEPRGLRPDGTIAREFRDQLRANQDWSLTLDGYERLALGRAGTHNLAFGVERVSQDWRGRFATARERERGGPVPGISLLHPAYGLTHGGLYSIAASAYVSQSIQSDRTGLFVQD